MIKQAENFIITCPELLVIHFNDHSRQLVIRASAWIRVNMHDLENSFHLHLTLAPEATICRLPLDSYHHRLGGFSIRELFAEKEIA